MKIKDPFQCNAYPTHKKTIIHIRTDVFNQKHAPFIPQTIYGLVPFFNNVVLATDFDSSQNDGVLKIKIDRKDLNSREWVEEFALLLQAKFENIIAVVGHFGNGMRCGSLLAEALSVPIMGIFGGSDVNVEVGSDKYRKRYKALFDDKNAYFITVASYLAEKLINLGAPRARTYAWRRGVDFSQFDVPSWQSKMEKRPIKIIMAGRYIEVKGHEFAIKGFANAIKSCPDLELNFYGEGPLEIAMKSLARELGIHEKVKFHGIVPRTLLLEKLKSAHIGLLTSTKCRDGRTEGIPNILVETQAMGLPVVATNNGGISEVVSDGNTGFLVDERDINGISSSLIRLGINPDLRKNMGEAARIHIQEYFDRDKQARVLAAKIGHMAVRYSLMSLRENYITSGQIFEAAKCHSSVSNKCDNTALTTDRGYRVLQSYPKWKISPEKSGVFIGFIFKLYAKIISKTLFYPFKKSPSGNYLNRLSKYFPEILNDIRSQIYKLHSNLDKTSTDVAILRNELAILKKRLVAQGKKKISRQTMQIAQCPYCPHANMYAEWHDELCPMDVGCLNALEHEFSGELANRINFLQDYNFFKEPSFDGVLFDDKGCCEELICELDSDSKNYIRYEGAFQGAGRYIDFFAGAKRVLKNGGLLEIIIWPLYRGVDGGKLHGSLETPFAHVIFDSRVIEEYLGHSINHIKCVNIQDIESKLEGLGFKLRSSWKPDAESNPCQIEFQARFCELFSTLGYSAKDLARAYGAVWQVDKTE